MNTLNENNDFNTAHHPRQNNNSASGDNIHELNFKVYEK